MGQPLQDAEILEYLDCLSSDFEDDDEEDQLEELMDGRLLLEELTGEPEDGVQPCRNDEFTIPLVRNPDGEEEEEEKEEEALESEAQEIDEPSCSGSQEMQDKEAGAKRSSGNRRKEYGWRKRDFPIIDTEWMDQLPDPPEEDYSPIQYFKMFISEQVIDILVEETNKYAHQKEGIILGVSKDEIEKYLGILLHMGVVKMPQYRMYWSKDCRYGPIADILSRNRFDNIKKYFHLCDNTKMRRDPKDPGFDKLFKVRPILDVLKRNLNAIPAEEKHSIDEQIIPCKSRSKLKQYVKGKPHKWGFKSFTRAGASGIMYDFSIYIGKGTCPDKGLGFSADIVCYLVETLSKNRNYKLYFDNWFSSIHLVEELKKDKFWCVGTIRSNRTGKCPVLGEKDMKKKTRGSVDYRVSQSDVAVVTWLDRKPINFVSSYCAVEPTTTCLRFSQEHKKKVDIPMPVVVKEYNQFMGGVDLADMLLELYRINLKSNKWYMRIIYWCLNVGVVNGWLLYRRHQKQKNQKVEFTLLQFQSRIASALTSANKVIEKKRGRPSSDQAPSRKRTAAEAIPIEDVRFDQVAHFPSFSVEKKRCKVCIKGVTMMTCTKCKVHLCLTTQKNCFQNFHLK